MNENEIKQDEIIHMALEAGCDNYGDCYEFVPEALERFAALVAAHEKKFWMEQIEVECNEAVLAEREACAKVVESGVLGHGDCAAAIRARGEK